MYNLILHIIIYSTICISISSCSKSTTFQSIHRTNSTPINEFIYQTMQENYLWNDTLPKINIANYNNEQEILSVLKNDLDRFSFITSKENHKTFQNGQFYGFGLGIARQLETNQLLTTFTFSDCPAAIAGIKRSTEIKAINHRHITTLSNEDIKNILENNAITITYYNDDHIETTKTIHKKECDFQTVLFSKIFHLEQDNIGYINYKQFINANLTNELYPIMELFKNNNINKLILDLRYNSGGELSVAKTILNILLGNQETGNIQMTATYNQNNPHKNKTYIFLPHHLNLNLDEIIFLNSESTASASELIQSALMPYIKITKIGQTTNGKPIGMTGFSFENIMFFPITFKIVNANGETGYFNGIQPDIQITNTDIYPFGDENDPYLKMALHYIKNNYTQIPKTRHRSMKNISPETTMNLTF